MFRLCRADGQDEEGELGGEWVDRQRHQRGQDHLPGTHSSSRAVRSRTEENNSHNMGRHAQINSSQCHPGKCCYIVGVARLFYFLAKFQSKNLHRAANFKNLRSRNFIHLSFFVIF